MGRRWTREKGSFLKHLYRLHKCQCGREVRGNAFYAHAKKCPVYQEWRQRKWEEMLKDLESKGIYL